LEQKKLKIRDFGGELKQFLRDNYMYIDFENEQEIEEYTQDEEIRPDSFYPSDIEDESMEENNPIEITIWNW
jgi:hypothetical protein